MINILKLWIMSDNELARIKHNFYCRGIASERKFK